MLAFFYDLGLLISMLSITYHSCRIFPSLIATYSRLIYYLYFLYRRSCIYPRSSFAWIWLDCRTCFGLLGSLL